MGLNVAGQDLISARRASPAEAEDTMRKQYDFSKGKRGAVANSKGKTQITIMLDDDVIEAFREHAEAQGIGYQTAINEALRNTLGKDNAQRP